MVCLLAAPWVQLSVSAGNGWPHNALQHLWLMPISCHFRDCKALLVTSLDSCKWRYTKCRDLYLYLCLENLKMSGNLTAVMDFTKSQGNVRENLPKMFIVSCTFASIQVFRA